MILDKDQIFVVNGESYSIVEMVSQLSNEYREVYRAIECNGINEFIVTVYAMDEIPVGEMQYLPAYEFLLFQAWSKSTEAPAWSRETIDDMDVLSLVTNYSNGQTFANMIMEYLLSGAYAFSAPETFVTESNPKSFQFSMGLMCAFLMQNSHPWGLRLESSSLVSYRTMRNRKPSILLDGEIAQVVKKSLSINPVRRFDSMYDFINALAAALEFELPKDFIPSPLSFLESSVMPRNIAELHREIKNDDEKKTDNTAQDNNKPDIKDSKEPQINVKMSVRVGDGFKAVAGMSKLKDDLQRDFIDIVNNKELAAQFGLTIPGVLMYGPPGTGKTYIAKRLAEELGIDVIIVTPSDLGNIYLHGSQMMIKQLFDQAEKQAVKNNKGVLLVFDEIDAVAPERNEESNNQSGEVAELLVQLNESSSRGVYVIGTTNCLDRIDKAVIRSGRLDKVVYVGLPDESARAELFKYELSLRPSDKDIDVNKLATMTEGFTSSDISFIVKESARYKFAEIVRSKSRELRGIDQATIEKVISTTRPSVTPNDMDHYEKMRDTYASGGEKKQRNPVGFVTRNR